MTTPLRWLYGGSNRPHHLRMSLTCAIALASLSAKNPGVIAGGYVWQMPHPGLWLVAGGAAYGHELWAGSDRDHEKLRAPKEGGRSSLWWLQHSYWLPYDHFVKHRGVLSHGLVVGTIARVTYGWWPVLLGLWMLAGVSPFWAAWLGIAMGIGFFLNDLCHLLLDL